eukprot:1931220-Prorocentrum_lima.AAC.1
MTAVGPMLQLLLVLMMLFQSTKGDSDFNEPMSVAVCYTNETNPRNRSGLFLHTTINMDSGSTRPASGDITLFPRDMIVNKAPKLRVRVAN